VNKAYNDVVWSVEGVRSLEPKIRAFVAAMEENIWKRTYEHSEPMHWAARFGNAPAVRALLKSGVGVNDIVDEAGGVALATAAAFDQITAINALIDAGADLNTQSDAGGPPMCFAAESGSTAAVMALIHAGADMNLADLMGYTPLQLAAGGGYVACTAVLIQAGADISKVNGAGMTPLDVAMQSLNDAVDGSRYEEIAKLLRVAELFW
jgi:ankyrin repeat protein